MEIFPLVDQLVGRERNKDSEIDFEFLLETLLDTEKETAELSLPQDFEILDWCPAGPVLPPVEKVPF